MLRRVLRKLVTLISRQAVLEAEGEAARRQAESATEAAQKLLDDMSKESSKEDADNMVRRFVTCIYFLMIYSSSYIY